MKLNVLKDEKEELEMELENVTLAELLRIYLNKDSEVEFASWKREHPSKKPILKIKSKNPKKTLKEAISVILKDLEKVEKDFEKLK
jgi:DNA-directed RNA polymerase subunit L